MATTLAQLRTAIRQRSDMENTQFITDAELTSYINASLSELYDLLVKAYGEDYFLDAYQVATVVDQEDYGLPTDFYKALGVDVTVNGYNYALERFSFRQRNHLQSSTPFLYSAGDTPYFKYRFLGSNIRLTPKPAAVYTITVHYIPRVTQLVNDVDEVNSVFLDGWMEYVVVDAAIKCLQKEESDVSVLMAQKQRLTDRIELMSKDRDLGEPESVVETNPYFVRDWRL